MLHLQLTTPVGTLALTCTAVGKLSRMDWLPVFVPESGPKLLGAQNLEHLPATCRSLLEGLQRYFEQGDPLDAEWLLREGLETLGWSSFQRDVYSAVLEIPQGETRTYAWVARRLKRPGAGRAVGQALRRNSQLIAIPCHRVVSADDIGGFMGLMDPDSPELRFKQQLLQREHSWRNPAFSFFGQSA